MTCKQFILSLSIFTFLDLSLPDYQYPSISLAIPSRGGVADGGRATPGSLSTSPAATATTGLLRRSFSHHRSLNDVSEDGEEVGGAGGVGGVGGRCLGMLGVPMPYSIDDPRPHNISSTPATTSARSRFNNYYFIIIIIILLLLPPPFPITAYMRHITM